MGMMLRLLRRVVGVITYPYVLSSLHNDKFERANGNLSPNAPWVHSAITSSYNRILDGKVVGPTSSYSMDIVDIRIPNKSGYIRGRVTTPIAVAQGGGQTRLNFKSGRTYNSSTSSPQNTFLTLGFSVTGDGSLFGLGGVFQRAWGGAPDWFGDFLNVAPYQPNDEVAVMWSGRVINLFHNGQLYSSELTDDQWTAGYFAGIGLDTGHSFEEVEVGYLGPLEWREYGDSFKSPKLDNLWNLSPNKAVVVDGALQADAAWGVASSTYYGWGVSKQQMHEDDQIIRGILKAPSGTIESAAGAFVMGRCSSNPADTTAFVSFIVTPGSGAAINTTVNGVNTNRNIASAAVVGTLVYPVEIELQCIGIRYFGLINGQPVCEWKDTTGLVAIGEGRRGWGWMSTLRRNSSTFTYGPALDAVYAYGNENMPFSAPEIFGVSSSVVPLSGVTSFVVQGTNFTAATKVFVGGTLCTLLNRWSSNEIEFVLPAKAVGTYDLTVTSPFGDATLVGAIQYVAAVPRGKYEPTTTPLTAGSTWIKIPLNAADPATTSATVNGVITGLPKGYYRFRALYTLTTWRSDVRYKTIIPAGELPTYIGPNSSGTVDNVTDFGVGDNGSLQLQFYRSGSGAQTVDPEKYDFELILLSATKLPAWLTKSGTQLLGTVANVFEKITGWTPVLDVSDTTTVVNDEIIVPETGDYTIEWSGPTTTATTTNTVRVTNQLGVVIASKTTPATAGSQVVTLTKGHSLKLELSVTNVSSAGRRTVTTAAVFRITPVI